MSKFRENNSNTTINNFYILSIAFFSAIAGLLFGFDLVVISGALDFIAEEFFIKQDQVYLKELIVSAVPGGALIGAIISSYFSEKIGRKYSIFMTAIIFFMGTLLVAISTNIISVILGRLIMGIAVGLSSMIVPMYLAEISPPNIRGSLIFLYQFAITIGISFGFFINYIYHSSCAWRKMFSIGLIPSLLLAIGMLILPESPSWLINKGKLKYSIIVLKRIYHNQNEVTEIIKSIKKTTFHKVGGLKLLFSKRLRPLVFVSFGLFVFQQLTGINTIFYYAPVIFKSAGFMQSSSATLISVITGIVFVMSTILGVLLVDRVGRRILLLTGMIGIGICQLLQGIALNNFFSYSSILSVSSSLLAISFYAFSITGIAYLIMSEIFPLNIRSIGMSVASCANWGINMLVAGTFLSLGKLIGLGNTFFLYSLFTLCGLFFVYCFVPETKGIKLENIEKNLYSGVSVRYIGKKIIEN
jgi:sugar porter (SP) family MFS transporter